MRYFFVILLTVFVVWTGSARERMIVKLRTATVPMSVQQLQARALIPESLLRTKPQEQVLSAQQQEAWAALQRYIVVDVDDRQREVLAADAGVESITSIRRIGLHEVVSDDSLSAEQWALPLVGAPAAWKKATADGILVGVLDTGVDWDHPDLKNRLAVNEEEDLNNNGTFEPWPSSFEEDGVFGDLNGVDDDGNGYVDDVIGYDFVDQSVRNIGDDRDRDPIPFDEQGHGTSVAGVIGAEANNGIGIAGLAYDARIVTMRAFDATGNAEEDDIAAALVYAALNGVKVVNMSFGDGVDSPVMRDAVRFAASYGCVLIASAGNSGTVSRQFPAGYDEVMAIAATNSNDVRAPFSSTGSLVDLSAPGDQILTTAVAGRYRTVSGTSFAAPMVAATAAMMLELDPTLSASEIRTMISESSLDLGDRGWDGFYGAGRLQADHALALVGKGRVEIVSPINEQEVDLSTAASFVVTGSTIATLFDHAEVFVGRGVEPATWSVVGELSFVVSSDTLAVIDSSKVAEGDHVVRLVVYLKDGRTLEHRKRIRVVKQTPLRFAAAEVVTAWLDDRKAAVVTVTSTRPTQLRAVVKATAGDSVWQTDIQRYTRTHSIVIPNVTSLSDFTVRVECVADNGARIDTVMSYTLGSIAAPTTGWTSKNTAPWTGYVLNDVRDLYQDGGRTVAFADLSDGNFGNMITSQRVGTNWVDRDTSSNVWIPRGMGDANGNGRLELLGHVVGKAVLFEAASNGGDPFTSIIFGDTVSRNNGAGMADINGDGREEVLMLSDSGCIAVTFRNGRFERLGIAVNPTPPAQGNASNRVDEISIAAGDFDADGRVEVAFSDTDGDLVIAEWNGTEFTTEFTYLSVGVGGSGYVGAADVDGNGTKEVLYGVPDEPNALDNGEYGRQVWTYRMFRAAAANTYEMMWAEHFSGVRYGIGYRNGLGVGDLNKKAGDEVAICMFPRLYVFAWEQDTLRPLWYKTDVVTPRFLTYDFDNNGTAELGYGTTLPELGVMTAFTFSEYSVDDSKLATPQGLRGRSIAERTVALSWMPVDSATAYRVYRATNDDAIFRVIDTVSATSITIDTLQRTQGYRFRISALPAEGSSWKESDRSSIVDVGLHQRVRPLTTLPGTIDAGKTSTGISVTVQFSGPMLQRSIEPTSFALVDDRSSLLAVATSAVLASDSAIIVSFRPVASWKNITDTITVQLQIGALAATPSVYDAIGMPTEAGTLSLRVVPSTSAKELILADLDVVSPSRLRLTYSEPVDATADQASAYTLTPLGRIASVTRIDASSVEIDLDPSDPIAPLGNTYYLTAQNVVSSTGIPITKGAGNTLAFVLTAENTDGVFVYPHPVRLGVDEYLTFANLPRQATVSILDQRFNEIASVTELDGNGGVRWDLRTKDGVPVVPGLYFYRVNGEGFHKIMVKR